jgi:hypothetical protein
MQSEALWKYVVFGACIPSFLPLGLMMIDAAMQLDHCRCAHYISSIILRV